MELLRKKLLSYCYLSDDELDQLMGSFVKVNLQPGERLFSEGDVVKSLYFILSGVLVYTSVVDGETSIIEFYSDGEMHTDFYSYSKEKPTVCSAQSEKATLVMAVSKEKLEMLYDSSMSFQRFGRKLAENYLLHILRRNYEKQIFSNEERYRRFLDKRYKLSQRVPQYKIASYLNITPVGLSKIRKRMFNKR
ncbi:MAG: Crp/Fnr family transcriptional regulator [Saprospiraceae bacterium]